MTDSYRIMIDIGSDKKMDFRLPEESSLYPDYNALKIARAMVYGLRKDKYDAMIFRESRTTDIVD